MANSLSAKKRIKQNAKSRTRNRARSSAARTQIKKFLDLAQHSSDVETVEKELRLTHKKIDRLACNGIIHKNKAARQKAQMARHFNALKNKAQ